MTHERPFTSVMDKGPRAGFAAEQFDHRAAFLSQPAAADLLAVLSLQFVDRHVVQQADLLLRGGAGV